MPVVDPAQFRTDFPEFADEAKYPDGVISFWENVGESTVGETAWGQLRSAGIELVIAHNLVLEANAARANSKGQTPGLSSGIIASRSVGPVSSSYDTTTGVDPSAGEWNLTIYGRRYWRIAMMVGAGGRQL